MDIKISYNMQIYEKKILDSFIQVKYTQSSTSEFEYYNHVVKVTPSTNMFVSNSTILDSRLFTWSFNSRN